MTVFERTYRELERLKGMSLHNEILLYQRTPIRRKRERPRVVHSERTAHITGHKRVRLTGRARDARRTEIFERAGGRCEEMVPLGRGAGWTGAVPLVRCPNRATEWSHKQHGPRKCDCMDCGIASCSACHRKRHNAGGKPIAVTKKSLKAAV